MNWLRYLVAYSHDKAVKNEKNKLKLNNQRDQNVVVAG